MRRHAERAARAGFQAQGARQGLSHRRSARAWSGSTWASAQRRRPCRRCEILDAPDDEINVGFVLRECNYLQALEGEIDTAHFGFLHGGHVEANQVTEDEPLYHTVTNRAPQFHVADAPWGTQYAGYRAAGPGRTYWRFANFLFPCCIAGAQR